MKKTLLFLIGSNLIFSVQAGMHNQNYVSLLYLRTKLQQNQYYLVTSLLAITMLQKSNTLYSSTAAIKPVYRTIASPLSISQIEEFDNDVDSPSFLLKRQTSDAELSLIDQNRQMNPSTISLSQMTRDHITPDCGPTPDKDVKDTLDRAVLTLLVRQVSGEAFTRSRVNSSDDEYGFYSEPSSVYASPVIISQRKQTNVTKPLSIKAYSFGSNDELKGIEQRHRNQLVRQHHATPPTSPVKSGSPDTKK